MGLRPQAAFFYHTAFTEIGKGHFFSRRAFSVTSGDPPPDFPAGVCMSLPALPREGPSFLLF
jgi:hypothetical protein